MRIRLTRNAYTVDKSLSNSRLESLAESHRCVLVQGCFYVSSPRWFEQELRFKATQKNKTKLKG